MIYYTISSCKAKLFRCHPGLSQFTETGNSNSIPIGWNNNLQWPTRWWRPMASKWIVVINGSGNDFFGIYSSPSHYLNQNWHIIDWTPRKKFHWTSHQIIMIYYSRNYNLKCRLQNVGHFAKAWNESCDKQKFRMAPVGTGTLGYNLWFLS